jgi:hypothetical protein
MIVIAEPAENGAISHLCWGKGSELVLGMREWLYAHGDAV